MPRTPVYFFSHGGPTIIEQTEHPAYKWLQNIGREITQKVKPKAVIVISAHWQAGPSTVEVNVGEHEPLIYDYYGFPPRFYELKYPSVGSASLGFEILSRLREAGVDAQPTKRGLDHGVFAGFLIAFNPDTNPLGVPLVQLSLYGNEDPAAHYRLGKALEGLRDEGVLVIGSGMAVHNLRDFRFGGQGKDFDYSVSFMDALSEAVAAEPSGREEAMVKLLRRPDARRAHPTFDHLLPVHVAAGAAGNDKGELLFQMPEGSMGWAQYRFGEVQTA